MTFEEIAQELGISRQRAAHLCKTALEKIYNRYMKERAAYERGEAELPDYHAAVEAFFERGYDTDELRKADLEAALQRMLANLHDPEASYQGTGESDERA